VIDRHDLTDSELALLEPLLPDRAPPRGGRWQDHRRIINGVLWRTRTVADVRKDLPSQLPPPGEQAVRITSGDLGSAEPPVDRFDPRLANGEG
jgi:transposase